MVRIAMLFVPSACNIIWSRQVTRGMATVLRVLFQIMDNCVGQNKNKVLFMFSLFYPNHTYISVLPRNPLIMHNHYITNTTITSIRLFLSTIVENS